MGKVEPWCKACGEGELPSELQDLEDTIHHHQGLYEHITTAYSEVSAQHMHTHILIIHKVNIISKVQKIQKQTLNSLNLLHYVAEFGIVPHFLLPGTFS